MNRVVTLFSRKAGHLARPASISCGSGAPLQEVLGRMAEAGSDHAVVLRGVRQVRGLITPHSLVRYLSNHGLRDARAADAMEPAPQLVSHDEPLYRLAPLFRGSEPLLVIDDDGSLLGVIRPAELLAQAMPATLVDESSSPSELHAIKATQAGLASELLAERIPATDVQQLLSAINEDLCRRALDGTIHSLEEDGWGRPPARFALLLMGSGGRGESLLAPDQDSGLVIEDYPDAAHGSIDGYFSELALRLTERLDAAGIPLCPGHVMGSNPLWRKTQSQWQAQVEGWIRRRSPQALLNACILLDVRGVAGDLALADGLREGMIRALAASPGFLRALMLNESIKQVGLGWFDRILTESDDSPNAGELDIKRNGIMPIVEAVRLYALSRNIGASSTLERLDGLRDAGALSADEHDDLRHAFGYMCYLLLRQQAENLTAGRPAGRHIPPASLTRREHDTLVRSMKASEALLRQVRQTLVGSGAY